MASIRILNLHKKLKQKPRIKNKQTSLIERSIISGYLNILRLKNEYHFLMNNQSFFVSQLS